VKPNDVTKSDHEFIWLEPLLHEHNEHYEGRQWCQDDVWSGECAGEECGGPTKYVRSDLYDAALLKLPSWRKIADAKPESETRYVLAYIHEAPGVRECSFTLTPRDDLWKYATHWMPLPEPPHG
jgi:hypothetical protein